MNLQPLPVVVDVDLVEELDHGEGVLHAGEVLVGAAVPLEVVDGCLVAAGDPVEQGDAAVACGVGPHGEEDVETGHALVPVDRVDVGVSAQVTDVEVPRDSGVREDDHELGLGLVPVGHVQAGDSAQRACHLASIVP